jgi:sugar O-acyltransferase (sialic acid O-acetyltransferase NeuD family)
MIEKARVIPMWARVWRRRPEESIVILGAGGFGRGILDVVDALNAGRTRVRVLGFLDPDPAALPPTTRPGGVIIGSDTTLATVAARYVIGIAEPSTRRDIDRMARAVGATTASPLVHPTCSLGGDTVLNDGVVLTSGVRVASNVQLGRHTHVNFNSTIGHDAVLGDYVTVFPLVAISGYAFLEDGVTMGTSSAVIPGVRIGAGATVAAGATVVRDVLAHTTVAGVPAEPLVRRSRASGLEGRS